MSRKRTSYMSSAVSWMSVLSVVVLLAACSAAPMQARVVALPTSAELEQVRNLSPVLTEDDFLTISLEMDPTDAQVLFRKELFDKSSFPVTLVMDGVKHPGRVEVMGSSTRRLAKRSILIKLDKGSEWKGQRRIALDAMANDDSMLRERMTWDTISALGMTAPEVRYRRLDVNGDFIGLFLQVEWIGPDMFQRFGLGAEGEFFSPDSNAFCGDLSAVSEGRARQCWEKIAPGDRSYASIAELGQGIADTPIENFDDFLARHFDVDSVLNWILVNTLTANGDTYNKNYFLYRSTLDQRWTVVPFDYDLAFGNNFDPFLPFPQTIFNDNFIYYYPPDLGAWSPLKEKVLRNDRLRAELLNRVRHLLGVKKGSLSEQSFGMWNPDVMASRVGQVTSLLSAYAREDLYQPVDIARFDEDVEAVRYFTRARWHYLRAKLFGPFPWDPELSFWGAGPGPEPQPLPGSLYLADEKWTGGETGDLALVDPGYGLVLAFLNEMSGQAGQVQRFSMELEMNQPPGILPQGLQPGNCIQRSWVLALKTPGEGVRADVTVEYLQENSARNELGPQMDEAGLVLWVNRAGDWEMLQTHVNPRANTLTARGVALPGASLSRFVACDPAAAE